LEQAPALLAVAVNTEGESMRRFFFSFAILPAVLALGLSVSTLNAAEVVAEKPKAETTAKNSDAKDSDAKDKSADEKKSADKSDEKKAEKEPTKARLAHIKIEGELPESAGQVSLFGDLGIDLRKTIARLDKAADDKKN
jgi:ClpP class serine protease